MWVLKDQCKRLRRWIHQRLAIITFGLLPIMAAVFSAFASSWHPDRTSGARYLSDERGQRMGLPKSVRKQAVFMGIGVGEYVLVTRRPSDILTSRSPINERIKATPLLTKAFDDIGEMRMPMSNVESGATNLEVLLREQPDVVVTWARIAENFEKIGFAVAGLGPVSSPERLSENTVLFSSIVDEPQKAVGIIDRSRQEQDRIAQDVASKVQSKMAMLILFSIAEGLWRVASGFRDVIDAAGGRNLGADFAPIPINAEQILNLWPEVIIIIGGAGLDDAAPKRLMDTQALQPLPAVKYRRVYATPPGVSGYMGTMIELPIYMQWLADVLHPQELGRNARMLAKRIYTAELGVEPNDGDLDDALAEFANRGSAVQTRVLNPVAR